MPASRARYRISFLVVLAVVFLAANPSFFFQRYIRGHGILANGSIVGMGHGGRGGNSDPIVEFREGAGAYQRYSYSVSLAKQSELSQVLKQHPEGVPVQVIFLPRYPRMFVIKDMRCIDTQIVFAGTVFLLLFLPDRFSPIDLLLAFLKSRRRRKHAKSRTDKG